LRLRQGFAGGGGGLMAAPRERVTIDPEKPSRQLRLEQRIFPEARATGFSHLDQEVAFFTQIAALLRPDDMVLDFGAGRGEWHKDDPSLYRRRLQNLRGRCAHVDGCDVDPIVTENETLDAAKVLIPGEPLPYENGRFDLIISRYVFEHVPDPEWAARELLRVTKPGGWICALTPNKWGYVALAARLVPNALHRRVLRRIQPQRREMDVFPTTYRLNTGRALQRHFGADADIYHYTMSAVPSYHFGSLLLFRLQLGLHRLLPGALGLTLHLFMRKRASAPRQDQSTALPFGPQVSLAALPTEQT
jgi:SAM-dependent methyltransferase